MKSVLIQFEAALLVASIVITSTACGSGTSSGNAAATNSPAVNTAANTGNANASAPDVSRFTDEELDEVLARIALYPDPLLAQIIPASTFVEQLKEARGTLGGNVDDSKIDAQDWDVSVKSVAHYPTVLSMMVEDEGWTTSLGQAYVLQPEDVGKSIQRLRDQAYEVGNLETTPQMTVIEAGDVIRIEPAQAKTIYVPQYNPETVYVEQPQQSGVSTGTAIAVAAIAFTTGLLIGAWLNNDYDYYGRGIYYHGWSGNVGWVNVNRAYVNVNHAAYVNHNYSTLHVNRNVVHHNTTAYRRNVTLNSSLRTQRVNNARVNNPNRVNNNLPRNNGGKNLDRNNLNQGRVNNQLPRTNAGDRGRNMGGSPKVNGGSRPNAGPTMQKRQAPSMQNRSAPSMQRKSPAPSTRSGGGGRRRG